MNRMMFLGMANFVNSVCDEHAPWKEVKIRSRSDPWITNEIRYKINSRYKIFKAAVSTNCPSLCHSRLSPIFSPGRGGCDTGYNCPE